MKRLAYLSLLVLTACGGAAEVPSVQFNATQQPEFSEAEIDAFVANNGYALDADLATVAKTGSFSDLLNLPSDLADGDQTCSEAEVDAFAGNNGYAQSSSLHTVATSGSFSDLTNVPSDLADGDQTCTEAQVDLFAANNGYALDADLAKIAKSGSFSDLADVPGDLADGDQTCTEAQVDGFVANNGYALTSSLHAVATSGSFSALSGTGNVVQKDVLGTISINGDYRYDVPREAYVNVPPGAFRRVYDESPHLTENLGYSFTVIGTSIGYSSPYTVELSAPVSLPPSVVITGFDCVVYDSHASGDLLNFTQASLSRTNLAAFANEGIGLTTISTTGTNSVPQVFAAPSVSAGRATVDNRNYVYSIALTWKFDAASSFPNYLAFLGCRIKYNRSAFMP